MVRLEVMKAAVIGMLPDRSSNGAVTEGCHVRFTEVQNFGVDKRVALQYRHTWVRVTMTLPRPTSSVVRNPVPFVRPLDWQIWEKI